MFTSWKEIQETREPILPPYIDPQYRNTKDLFVGGDLSGAVLILAAVPKAGGCISSAASYSSKDARRTPPTMVIPKNPSRRRQQCPTRQAPAEHTNGENISSTVYLEEEDQASVESDSLAHLINVSPPLPSYTPYMEGVSDSLERSAP